MKIAKRRRIVNKNLMFGLKYAKSNATNDKGKRSGLNNRNFHTKIGSRKNKNQYHVRNERKVTKTEIGIVTFTKGKWEVKQSVKMYVPAIEFTRDGRDFAITCFLSAVRESVTTMRFQ